MTVEAAVLARVCGWRRGLVGLLGFLLGASPLFAQSAAANQTFPIDEDPQGRVLNAQGEPIAGARIEVLCVGTGAGYARALEEGQRRLPILSAVSGRDGSFVLPITDLHRVFYGAGPGRFSLLVSKAGFRSWREPLSQGLYTYLGSEVTLLPRAEKDAIQVRVASPVEGMVFAYQARQDGGHDADRARWEYSQVPADGDLQLSISTLPWPRMAIQSSNLQVLNFAGQILYPGRSSRPVDLLSCGGKLELEAGAEEAIRPLQLRTETGLDLDSVWGIYRSPAGELLQFGFAGSDLPRDSQLALLWAGADGFVTMPVNGESRLELQTLAQRDRDLLLRVSSASTAQLDSVRVRVLRLLDSEWRSGTHPRRYLLDRQIKAGAAIRLPAKLLREPSLLLVSSPGHVDKRVLEPRALGKEVEIKLDALTGAQIIFKFVDERGQPVSGALLFLSDRFYDNAQGRGASPPRGLLRSDAAGRVDLGIVAAGNYRYRCVSKDRIPNQGRLAVTAGEDQTVELELGLGLSMRMLSVGPDDKPNPLAGAAVNITEARDTRRWGSVWSDSQGRLWLRGLPAESRLQLSPKALTGSWSSQWFDLDSSLVHAFTAAEYREVLLRVPDGSRELRTTLAITGPGRAGGSTSNTVGPPGKHATTSLFALNWFESESAQVMIGIGIGPPVRIRSSDADFLAAAGAPRVELDRRAILRRRELLFPGLDFAQLQQVRIQPVSPHYSGKMVSNRAGQMLDLDQDGRAWFVARDPGEYDCVVLHPEFLMATLSVPAEGLGSGLPGEAIEIRLRPGSALDFAFTLDEQGLQGRDMSLSIRGVDSSMVLYAQDFWQPAKDAKAGDTVWLPCPIALQPGEYEIDLLLGDRLRKKIMLLPGKPMTIELGKD